MKQHLTALMRKLTDLRAFEAADGVMPAAVAKPAIQWKPLLGNTIELADTGFQITYRQVAQGPFCLYTPEGSLGAWGGDLQCLKRFAEKLAADRAEFSNPRPQPFKPTP